MALSPKHLVKAFPEFLAMHRRMLVNIKDAREHPAEQHSLKMLHIRFLRRHLEMPTKRLSVFDVEIANLILEMHP